MAETLVTYGGGEILRSVFDAISMIVYGKEESFFRPLMVIAASVGAFGAIAAAFASQSADALLRRYLFPLLAISGLLIVPTSKVHIEDVLQHKAYTVSRVPFLLAKFAEVASTVSYKVTSTIESVMHVPQNTSYNTTGMLFGSENALDIGRLRISNADLESNLRDFVGQCVSYDLLLNRYSLDELRKTSDLWKFLGERTGKVGMMPYTILPSDEDHFKGTKSTGKVVPITCRQAIKRMSPHFQKQKEWFAKQEITKNLPLTFQALTGIQRKKQELIGQQLMMELLQGELNGGTFAATRAATQQRHTYQIMGALAGKSLVTIRIVFEALIYASFILVLPLCVLPGGIRYLKTWAGMALWIQLWPPLYAILSYIMQIVAQGKTAAIFSGLSPDQTGLSFFTRAGLQSLYSDVFAVAGYLSASIPFLSYAILKGGVGSFIHLAGAMMTPAHTSAGAAAAEQATGNYSLANTSFGQMSYDNTTAFQRNLAPSLSAGFSSVNRGTSSMVYGADETILKQANSELRQSVFGSSSASQLAHLAHQQASSQTEQSGEQLVESLSSHGREFADYARHLSQSENYSDTASSREAYDLAESARQTENLAANWGEQYGLGRQESMQLMSTAGGGVSMGINLPGIKAHLDTELKKYSSGNQATRDDVLNSALQVARSEDFQQNYQKVVSSTQSDTHTFLNDEGQRLATSMSHSRDQVSSSQQSWQSSQSAVEQFSIATSTSDQRSTDVRDSLNQDFVNWASKTYEALGGYDWVEHTLLNGSSSQKQELVGEFINQYSMDQGGFLSPAEQAHIESSAVLQINRLDSGFEQVYAQRQRIDDKAETADLQTGVVFGKGEALRSKGLEPRYEAAATGVRQGISLQDERLRARLSDRQQQTLGKEALNSLGGSLKGLIGEKPNWAQTDALGGRWRISGPGLGEVGTDRDSGF